MAKFSDEDEPTGTQFARRSLLLGIAQAAGFGLVGWRLYDLQVVHSGRYRPLAEENRINIRLLAPKRGRILDTFGRVLADNEEIFRATITPSEARDVGDILRRVSRLVPLSDDEIAKIVGLARGRNRNLPIAVASGLSFEGMAKLSVHAPSLPGVEISSMWRRRYSDGPSLSHVVGFVGSVERFGIDDDAVIRIPEIRIGKSGIELGFDQELRGHAGSQKSEVDARGRIMRKLETVDPIAGQDVTLSVDAELQKRVVERMAKAGRAATVVLDVSSGDVAVMASVPGFDPARIAGGISDADWASMASSEEKPLLNRAIAGLYTPGSTFLVVTALAALEAGVVAEDEHITCKGRYEYGGQIFRCSNPEGHGSITLHDAVRSSCEVFFCEMAARLGIAPIASAARAMGLGTASDIGLPDQKPGIVPDPDWKRGNLLGRWLGGETLLTGLGQGYMQATPLQLAQIAMRVASGRGIVPLLRRPEAAEPRKATQVFAELPFKSAHIKVVQRAMAAAVNDAAGSVKSARLDETKPLVAGQGGLSGLVRTEDDATGAGKRMKAAHAIFIGYMPTDAPRYAVATVIEHGGSVEGAAIISRDILSLIVGRDDGAHSKSGADRGDVREHDQRHQEAG